MAELYQQIAETINDMIPEEWNKVFAYAEVKEDVSKVDFYYYSEGKEKPVYVLEITDLFEIEENYLDILRYKLSDYFEELWNEFVRNHQEVWTSLTFILDRTGEHKIDYNYEDLSDVDDFERQVIWRYNYLGIEPSKEKKRARQIYEKYVNKCSAGTNVSENLKEWRGNSYEGI